MRYYVLSIFAQVFAYSNSRIRQRREDETTEQPQIDKEILWSDLSIADAIAKVIQR